MRGTLQAYINSPQPEVVVHPDPSCPRIQTNAKSGQRIVRNNPESISEEIRRFKNREYTFAADATNNDMWIEVV